MDKISFKEQPGRISQTLVVETSETSKKALLKALYKESLATGRVIVLTGLNQDDDVNAFVKSMFFGLGQDQQVIGIDGDRSFLEFFGQNTLYQYVIITNEGDTDLVVNGATTEGGSDLFTDENIAPGESKPIKIDQVFSAVTPFFFWSPDWSDNTASLKIISKSL